MAQTATLPAPTGTSVQDSSRLESNEATHWSQVMEVAEAHAGIEASPYTEFGSDPLTSTRDMGQALESTVVPSMAYYGVPVDDATSVFPQTPSMHPLQEWEGWVVEVGDDEFVARLTDLTDLTAGLGTLEEEAIIPNSEISEDDLNRLREGSIFRWVIGYERSRSGTKRRISQIVFRDLPIMTAEDISMGEEWARKVSQALRE